MVRYWRKTVLFLLIASMLAALVKGGMIVQASIASTQKEIQKTEEEKKKLESQQQEKEEEISDLKGEKRTVQGQLNNLNTQMEEIAANLEDLSRGIAEKKVEIYNTEIDLADAIATQEWQYECMVIRVKEMYERSDMSYFGSVLKAGGLAEMLNAAEYYELIADYDKRKLQEFKDNRALVEQKKALLEQEYAQLEDLKTMALEEEAKVSGLISDAKDSIQEYAEQISDAEKEAKDYEDKIKAKDDDLEALKKQLAEEIAMSQKAAQSTWRDISEVTFAENDRYLLANLIYCEAGGESYAGQLAVGAVVINRVLSSVYPDTVTGVIYQNKQFSPVASGRLSIALASDKATASCYQAADAAMAGNTNVGTCVYFRTPIEGLNGISIGGHVFY